MSYYWTTKEDIQLRTYWNVEHKTVGQIAVLMNRSIGSIIGRVHRLPNMEARKEGQSPAQACMPKKVATFVDIAFDGGGKLFEENNGCKWPTGERHFCGREMVQKKPYCELHAARAYVGRAE